jgi:hypothetical protein
MGVGHIFNFFWTSHQRGLLAPNLIFLKILMGNGHSVKLRHIQRPQLPTLSYWYLLYIQINEQLSKSSNLLSSLLTRRSKIDVCRFAKTSS